MLPDTNGVIGPDARRGSVIKTQKNKMYVSAAVKFSLSKKKYNNNNINIIL